MNNLENNNLENNNLENLISKLSNYFHNLYNIEIAYLNELYNNLESKDNKNKLLDIINNKEFLTIYNKLKNTNNENYISYNNLINLKKNIDNIVDLIYEINIYDEKTLLSDTSKNNINQNKIVILDMYKKIIYKFDKYKVNIINTIVKDFDYTYDNYINLTKFYKNNNLILELYVEIIKKYLTLDNINFNDLIYFNNNYLKIELVNKNLDNYNIKYNNNSLDDIKYLFKTNINIIKKNNNIINKFTQYQIYKSYNNLNDLFLDINNSTYKFKNNNLDTNNLNYIHKILIDYYKIEKEYLNIVILESNVQEMSYNIFNLLDSKYKLESDQGINNNFINKTKTIINKEEYKNLPLKDSNFHNDIYISNIKNIYIINNYQINKINKSDYLDILLSSNFIIIYKLDNLFYIMKLADNDILFLKYKDVNTLLQNKSNYYIENYNTLLEENILNKIEKNNMLELYQQKIELDYKNIKQLENIELKNKLLNKLKKEIKYNKNKKQEEIEKIINIIINFIYNFIQESNNIEFNNEIYLTYFSSISNLLVKIKKELNDNYDENILNNIDNILDNIYPNILTINNNILDKSYFLKL